jgi:hypothetical protein
MNLQEGFMIAAEVELTQAFRQQRQFVARTGSGHHLLLDDTAGGTGAKPIEMLAVGLAGCTAFDVITVLRQKIPPKDHRLSGARRGRLGGTSTPGLHQSPDPSCRHRYWNRRSGIAGSHPAVRRQVLLRGCDAAKDSRLPYDPRNHRRHNVVDSCG